MNTYKVTVRVPSVTSSNTTVVWTQITAQNPIAAKSLLEAQYGSGNVIGVPTLVK